jgi:hypothetical protein
MSRTKTWIGGRLAIVCAWTAVVVSAGRGAGRGGCCRGCCRGCCSGLVVFLSDTFVKREKVLLVMCFSDPIAFDECFLH